MTAHRDDQPPARSISRRPAAPTLGPRCRLGITLISMRNMISQSNPCQIWKATGRPRRRKHTPEGVGPYSRIIVPEAERIYMQARRRRCARFASAAPWTRTRSASDRDPPRGPPSAAERDRGRATEEKSRKEAVRARSCRRHRRHHHAQGFRIALKSRAERTNAEKRTPERRNVQNVGSSMADSVGVGTARAQFR